MGNSRTWFQRHKFVDWANANLAISGFTGDEMIADCPSCNAKQKMWVNTSSGQFICYRCLWSGSIYDIIEEVAGVDRKQARIIVGVDAGEVVMPVDLLDDVFKQITIVGQPEPVKPAVIEGAKWFGFTPTCECNAEAEEVGGMLEALRGRGFDNDLIVANRAGWAWQGRWAHRVLLPVFWQGAPVWWQAWDYTRKSKLKYMNPKNEDVAISKKALLYNIERWKDAEELVICEGIFNAWALEQVGVAATAAFGKSISPFQMIQLLNHPAKRFYIGLDPDARAEAVALYHALRGFGREALLSTLPMGNGGKKIDWNDMQRDTRLLTLRQSGAPDWFFDAA